MGVLRCSSAHTVRNLVLVYIHLWLWWRVCQAHIKYFLCLSENIMLCTLQPTALYLLNSKPWSATPCMTCTHISTWLPAQSLSWLSYEVHWSCWRITVFQAIWLSLHFSVTFTCGSEERTVVCQWLNLHLSICLHPYKVCRKYLLNDIFGRIRIKYFYLAWISKKHVSSHRSKYKVFSIFILEYALLQYEKLYAQNNLRWIPYCLLLVTNTNSKIKGII